MQAPLAHTLFFLSLPEIVHAGRSSGIARGQGQRGHMLSNWADLSITSFHKKTSVERWIYREINSGRERKIDRACINGRQWFFKR